MPYFVYKICCDDVPDYVYIGSTKAFRERKRKHKSCCTNVNDKSYHSKIYTTIRDNGGWDNWRMVIIEECGDITLTQARIKEEEWREKLKANMNSVPCYVTEEQQKERESVRKKEFYEENKEKIKEQKRVYREANKDKILIQQREYNKKNKEEKREKRKDYYEANKDKKKEYYEANKEKINEKLREKRRLNRERISQSTM